MQGSQNARSRNLFGTPCSGKQLTYPLGSCNLRTTINHSGSVVVRIGSKKRLSRKAASANLNDPMCSSILDRSDPFCSSLPSDSEEPLLADLRSRGVRSRGQGGSQHDDFRARGAHFSWCGFLTTAKKAGQCVRHFAVKKRGLVPAGASECLQGFGGRFGESAFDVPASERQRLLFGPRHLSIGAFAHGSKAVQGPCMQKLCSTGIVCRQRRLWLP